jgi:hypothetical protein
MQRTYGKYGLSQRQLCDPERAECGVGKVPRYRKTGNLRAVQLLLGHAKLESPSDIFGIEVDDALNMAEQIEFESSTAGITPVVALAPTPIIQRLISFLLKPYQSAN